MLKYECIQPGIIFSNYSDNTIDKEIYGVMELFGQIWGLVDQNICQ